MARDKPKTLPSSMRKKRRYLAFEILSEDDVSFDQLVDSFWDALLDFLGEFGTSRTDVWFVKDSWDERRQRGLVRCNHKTVEDVRAALALIKDMDGQRVIVNTLGVSGTMEGARKKFLGKRTLEAYD